MKPLIIAIASVIFFIGIGGSVPVFAPAPVAYATTTQGSNPAAQPTDFSPQVKDGMNTVMVWLASLFAWLVGAAAVLLDYSAYYTVVGMGAIVHNLAAVSMTWGILRDLGNIALIFGFLVAGITVILNTEFYGWSKEMIPMLIVAAVFINFSLFFSEAVVDVGNMFAVEFYTQINGGTMPTPASIGNAGISNEVISNAIMSDLGIQTIYGNARETSNQLLAGDHPWLVGFMSILLFTILAFVMFTLAGVLIVRFVMLLYYIIISPVGFAGWAIPRLQKFSAKWINGLIEQVVTAPVLFLLLYIALKIITDAKFLTGLGLSGANASSASTGFANGNLVGFGGFMLSFLIAMGMLLYVVYAAKRLGAAGVDMASRIGGRLSFGAISLAGRTTLGGLGLAMSSKRMQAWATDDKGKAILPRRLITFTGKRLANRTYDMRNAGLAKGLNAMGLEGVDVGKGATVTARKFANKFDLEQQGRGGLNKINAVRQWFDESDKEYREAQGDVKVRDAKNAIQKANADFEAGVINETTHKEIVEKQNEALKGAVAKASPKRLALLAGESGGEIIAPLLSSRQFVQFMEDKDIDSAKKEKIKEGRFKPLGQLFEKEKELVKKAKDAKTASEKEAFEKEAAKVRVEIREDLSKRTDKEIPFISKDIATNPLFAKSLSSKAFVSAVENIKSESIKETMIKTRLGDVDDVVKNDKLVSVIRTADEAEAKALAAEEKAKDKNLNTAEKAKAEKDATDARATANDAKSKRDVEVNAAAAKIKEIIKEQPLTADELGVMASHLGEYSVANPALVRTLDEDTYKDFQKKNVLSAVSKQNAEKYRKERFDVDTVGADTIAEEVKKIGGNYEKLKKNIPAKALTDSRVLKGLGSDISNVIDMAQNGGLSATDKAKLGQYIRDELASLPEKKEDLTPQQILLKTYVATNKDVMDKQFGGSTSEGSSSLADNIAANL